METPSQHDNAVGMRSFDKLWMTMGLGGEWVRFLVGLGGEYAQEKTT